jgi:hypothetical protein
MQRRAGAIISGIWLWDGQFEESEPPGPNQGPNRGFTMDPGCAAGRPSLRGAERRYAEVVTAPGEWAGLPTAAAAGNVALTGKSADPVDHPGPHPSSLVRALRRSGGSRCGYSNWQSSDLTIFNRAATIGAPFC